METNSPSIHSRPRWLKLEKFSLGSFHFLFIYLFFLQCFVCVHVVYLYSSMNTIISWKRLFFILSEKSDLHMIDNLSITFHAFVRQVV